jgi:hypothetical protein
MFFKIEIVVKIKKILLGTYIPDDCLSIIPSTHCYTGVEWMHIKNKCLLKTNLMRKILYEEVDHSRKNKLNN